MHYIKSNVRPEPAPVVHRLLEDVFNEDPLLEQVSLQDAQRIEFLKSACSVAQKQEIITAMKLTFPLRTGYRRQILENFPRFADIPYLVNIKF